MVGDRSPQVLPPCVYFKNGAYYLVKRGKWLRLSKDRDEAIILAQSVLPPPEKDHEPILAYAYRVLTRARQNAKGRRGLSFSLSRHDIHRMLEDVNWRCAVTRTPFSLEIVGKHKPFAPSIDRIDCAIGYEPENCRMVCVATNFAMNQWGERVLRTLLLNMHGG